MSIQQAFDAFMAKDFQSAVDSATKAAWYGTGYSIELFDDGTYRLMWNNHIGTRYVSPGLILSVPDLNDEEWDEDPSLCYYAAAEQVMRDYFQEGLTCIS